MRRCRLSTERGRLATMQRLEADLAARIEAVQTKIARAAALAPALGKAPRRWRPGSLRAPSRSSRRLSRRCRSMRRPGRHSSARAEGRGGTAPPAPRGRAGAGGARRARARRVRPVSRAPEPSGREPARRRPRRDGAAAGGGRSSGWRRREAVRRARAAGRAGTGAGDRGPALRPGLGCRAIVRRRCGTKREADPREAQRAFERQAYSEASRGFEEATALYRRSEELSATPLGTRGASAGQHGRKRGRSPEANRPRTLHCGRTRSRAFPWCNLLPFPS